MDSMKTDSCLNTFTLRFAIVSRSVELCACEGWTLDFNFCAQTIVEFSCRMNFYFVRPVYLPCSFQGISNESSFGCQLSLVIYVLELTAATVTEIFARRRFTNRRRLDDFFNHGAGISLFSF